METIHLKTIDPISQDLLKSAGQRGIKLSWDRFERLLPQDGFLRTGLSCPYGCLQGPCRIDPFGRGPDRGLCGLNRDGMVAALLLRLTLSGALEAMPDEDRPLEPSWPSSLKRTVSHALKKLGGGPNAIKEIRQTAALLKRPSESPDGLIIQALRLSLLTIGWLCKDAAFRERRRLLPLKVGYGLLAQNELNIGVCGRPFPKFLQALLAEVDKDLSGLGQVLSLGDLIPTDEGYLPCVCPAGEAELVLSSGAVNLLIVGPGTDPATIELCRLLDIPVVSTTDPQAVPEGVKKAQEKKGIGQGGFKSQESMVEEAEVIAASSVLEESFKKGPTRKLAILGGADHPYHPLGWIPTEVPPLLLGEGFTVAGFGDCAIWMVKRGLASPRNKRPVRILDGQGWPMIALKALADSGRFQDLKGICYTGMKGCLELAVAMGLAGLGLRVGTAVPLPLWGSEKVRNLLQEKLAALGGSLTHFDHPAQAEEIVDWFLK